MTTVLRLRLFAPHQRTKQILTKTASDIHCRCISIGSLPHKYKKHEQNQHDKKHMCCFTSSCHTYSLLRQHQHVQTTAGPAQPTHIQIRTKASTTFVSRHNTSLTKEAICSYVDARIGLNKNNKGIRVTRQHVILRECPFCNKPTNEKADNFYKLYIMIGGGAYFCHRCGAKGSWYDFKKHFGGFDVEHSSQATGGTSSFSSSSSMQAQQSMASRYNPAGIRIPSTRNAPWNAGKKTSQQQKSHDNNKNSVQLNSCSPMPKERLAAIYISSLLDSQSNNAKAAMQYLTEVRGIEKHVLRKYGVGIGTYNFPSQESGLYTPSECVTFPWIMRTSEVSEQETLKGNTYRWKEKLPSSPSSVSAAEQESNDDDNDDDSTATPEELERDRLNKTYGPWITRRIKARALENKGWQRLDPPGGGWGMFGWHTVPHDALELVITEGEYDAMAVYQATGRPAVSLPNGCRSFPLDILPMLERFEKIILWMDNDGPGQEGAESFAKKIGLGRCLVVRPNGADAPKDANDALRANLDLEELIQRADVVPHESILTFSEIRSQVLHEICNPHEYSGAAISSLPTLTNILKGVRRGELTVLTGATGSGKTTFLSQLSLDFAEKGVNVLWGSFEVKNTRLMHKLLRQFSREPLPSAIDLKKSDGNASEILNALADRFEELPLYFMRFHGGSNVEDIVDAMEYAIYVHDVEHIVLDNLQFMLSRDYTRGSFDKFDIQDYAVEVFRKFATEKNVHITLVVHPRKEDEGQKLGISSIYGSAKSTQEADTVLILQSDGRRKYIDVKKNRYDGTLGFCPLHFHLQSGRYEETPEMGIDADKYNRQVLEMNNSMIESGKRSKVKQKGERNDGTIIDSMSQNDIDSLFTGNNDGKGKSRSLSSLSPAKLALYRRIRGKNDPFDIGNGETEKPVSKAAATNVHSDHFFR